MLVLSRKRGEGVVIGNDVTVKILDVRGDRVKLGFSAPGEMPIHRAEVWQQIEETSAEVSRQGAQASFPACIELSCSELQGLVVSHD